MFPCVSLAQTYVVGLGGAVSLSNAAAVTNSQPPSASNYDSKVGPALNVAVGRHLNDWFSVQGGYIWNRNRIVSTEISGLAFQQRFVTATQQIVSADVLVYFRARQSAIRPYLSGGPVGIQLLSQRKLGLRAAVGMDVKIRNGWSLRYSFSEIMSTNPFAADLHPASSAKLMNFQNLFGFVKVF